MGDTRWIDLNTLISRYGLKTYVETGTGTCVTLARSLEHPFESLHTIDVDEGLLEAAKAQYGGDKRVTFYCDYSKNALPVILDSIPPDPVLFFLDAHFPGADYHRMSYSESILTYKQDAFPLEHEVDIIVSGRDTSKDVFIIDDLILYEPDAAYDHVVWNGPYEYAHLQKEVGSQTNLQFFYDALAETHDFEKYTKDQGYVVALPKGV